MEPVDPSFAEWAEARQHALLRTAVLLTGDHHLAEDLVQEALTKVALRWRRLHDGDPDAYARRILVNDHVSWWRRGRRESTEPVPDRPTTDPLPDRRLVLLEALARLAPRQRAVLVLRYYDDLGEAEIATALGVSAGTVKSQAHDGLRRLRALAPELADLMQEET